MEDKNIVFIYLTAYSPRINIIASLRAEKISKYISKYFKTYIISGIPKNLIKNNQKLKNDIDIGKSQLIEIPSLYDRNKLKSKKNIQNKSKKIQKKFKIEFLPLIEYFFPVSPGGMVYHNKKLFRYEIKNVIEKNKGKKIIIFASFGPSFILKVANEIKKYNHDIFLISDFRDWAYKYYEGAFYNSYFFKKFTRKMIKNSDISTFVTKVLKDYYCNKLNIERNKLFFLPNGYDEEKIIYSEKNSLNDNFFNIVYTGSFHHQSRNPGNFLKAVKLLLNKQPNFKRKIRFIYLGKDGNYLLNYIKDTKLEEIFIDKGFVSREDSLKIQNSADLLLLITYTGKNNILGDSIITGKFYEYINTETKILTLGTSNWEMKNVLESDNSSKLINNNNIEEIASFLFQMINEKDKKIDINKRRETIKEFSYDNISKKLYKIIKDEI
jgi:glycosyltransferase involved in cell wall biosynthesis